MLHNLIFHLSFRIKPTQDYALALKKKRGGRGGTTVFISKGRQQKQNHEQTIFLNTSDTIHPHENKKNNHQVIKFVADSNKIFCKN